MFSYGDGLRRSGERDEEAGEEEEGFLKQDCDARGGNGFCYRGCRVRER